MIVGPSGAGKSLLLKVIAGLIDLRHSSVAVAGELRLDEKPVEFTGEHWYVTKNDWPYAGTAANYLIVPHRHVASFDELPDEAGAELWSIKRRLRDQLAPLATATVERSGDMRLNGGSVAHLHTHFVALPADPVKTVRFRVSARAGE